MPDPVDELITASKIAWSLLVSGDNSYNTQADRLLRAITEAEKARKK